jgi:hypothetical protein
MRFLGGSSLGVSGALPLALARCCIRVEGFTRGRVRVFRPTQRQRLQQARGEQIRVRLISKVNASEGAIQEHAGTFLWTAATAAAAASCAFLAAAASAACNQTRYKGSLSEAGKCSTTTTTKNAPSFGLSALSWRQQPRHRASAGLLQQQQQQQHSCVQPLPE